MLRNRVNPWGELISAHQRGSLMGNRGILHNSQNEIVRNWAHKSWVTCLLAYKDIKRPKPFSAGNYSELFFLDEATAFAAGHRPCTYCQRARSKEFKSAWLAANISKEQHPGFSMTMVDDQIHEERAAKGGVKITYQATLSSLPTGAIFEHEGKAYLVYAGKPLLWSFDGYTNVVPLPRETMVNVLTPKSIVAVFQGGFTPQLHQSAGA